MIFLLFIFLIIILFFIWLNIRYENFDNKKDWSKNFTNYKEAYVFGKGPTFKVIKKKDPNTLFVCINDSVNHIPDCDILVTNDIETFEKINKKKLANVKYILIPYSPHFQEKPHANITYHHIFKQIKHFFKGQFIVYNLSTSPKKPQYIDLKTAITGSNNGVEFILQFIPSVKTIQLYGVGVLRNGYADQFYNHQSNEKNAKQYKDKKIKMIKNNIIEQCDKKKVICHFH